MKIKVSKRFVDRETREMWYAGEEYECDEERAAELIAAGVAEPVAEKKPKRKKKN